MRTHKRYEDTYIGMRTHAGMRTHILQAYSGFADTYYRFVGYANTYIVRNEDTYIAGIFLSSYLHVLGIVRTHYRFVGYANTYIVGEKCGHIYCMPSRYADTYIAGILGMRAHIA